MGLTVGFVSGIIAAVVFVVQLLIPFAIGLAVIGLIAPENSIVSWSVVSRLLHSTQWPSVLGADTAASNAVSGRVKAFVWLQFLTLLLISIASIVTPLGLYEQLSPTGSKTPVPFQYVPDLTTFGKATSPRDGYRPIRVCYTPRDAEFEHWCPNAPENFSEMTDIAEAFSIWPGSVNIFTSGETAETVSSVFDMQWRSFRAARDVPGDEENDDSPYSQGYYRHISQFVNSDELMAVDGLIVDAKDGRIGLRNHTVPVEVEHGARWTEDILFIEPEARCVNLNYTVDYTTNGPSDLFGSSANSTSDPVLVDRGGFADLPHDFPDLDPESFQDDPALYERAFRAAWRSNMLHMMYWNITTNGSDGSEAFSYMKSHKGKEFDIVDRVGVVKPGLLQSRDRHGQFVELASSGSSSSDKGGPFGLTNDDEFSIGPEACGYPSGYEKPSNMSLVAATCGIVVPPARRVDGGNPLFIEDIGAKWETPLYSCAASVKAVIREVTFQLNGTGALSRLVVDSINEKSYPSPADMPLWGVEKFDNHTLKDALPLWGVVSKDVAERPDISTVQREHLWLPGYETVGRAPDLERNMPGVTFYSNALSRIFEIGLGAAENAGLYTGVNDAGLFTKWLELSESTSGVEKMLRLVWTDLAANSVVGTRSWLSSSESSSSGIAKRDNSQETVNVPVNVYTPTVKYNVRYAVPAILAALVSLTLGGMTLLLLCMRRTGIAKMRIYLAQTSAGRVLGHFLHPGQNSMHSSTKDWTQQVGKNKARLPGTEAEAMAAGSTAYRGAGYHPLASPKDGAVKTEFELQRTS